MLSSTLSADEGIAYIMLSQNHVVKQWDHFHYSKPIFFNTLFVPLYWSGTDASSDDVFYLCVSDFVKCFWSYTLQRAAAIKLKSAV